MATITVKDIKDFLKSYNDTDSVKFIIYNDNGKTVISMYVQNKKDYIFFELMPVVKKEEKL